MGEKYFPCSKTTWLLDHNEGADIDGTLESRQSEKNGKSKSCTRADFVIASEGDIIIIIIFGCVFVLFCALVVGQGSHHSASVVWWQGQRWGRPRVRDDSIESNRIARATTRRESGVTRMPRRKDKINLIIQELDVGLRHLSMICVTYP